MKKRFFIITTNALDDRADFNIVEAEDEQEIWKEIEESSHNLDIDMVLNEKQFFSLFNEMLEQGMVEKYNKYCEQKVRI